jgi:hypothetical protein
MLFLAVPKCTCLGALDITDGLALQLKPQTNRHHTFTNTVDARLAAAATTSEHLSSQRIDGPRIAIDYSSTSRASCLHSHMAIVCQPLVCMVSSRPSDQLPVPANAQAAGFGD